MANNHDDERRSDEALRRIVGMIFEGRLSPGARLPAERELSEQLGVSRTGAAFMWLVGDLVNRSGSFGAAFVLAGMMPLVALVGFWFATSTGGLPRASD